METILFLLGLGALFGLVVYAGYRQQKKRTEAMQAAAERLGWGFQEEAPLTVIPGLERFELFSQGRQRQIRNFLAGQKGDLRAAVFDYSYVTGSGKSRTTWRQSVLYLRSDRLDLPSFSLRPEHVFHRIAGVFGYQDIDLPSHPEFSQKYLLRGADESAIRHLFHSTVLDFYESHPRSCTAAAGEELFFWRPGRLLPPEQVPSLLEQGLELLGRLPMRSVTGAQEVR